MPGDNWKIFIDRGAELDYGNQGVNILRAPGLAPLDLSLLRNFAFGEGRRIQLRGVFFNATNRTNLGNPASTFGGRDSA